MRPWQYLDENEQEAWRVKATDLLIRMAWIPFTDEVWASDTYAAQIEEKAEEMYADYQERVMKL
jgi:hypothetical protein